MSGSRTQRPRETQPLLLTAGQHPCRRCRAGFQTRELEGIADADGSVAAGDAAQTQRMPDIGGGRATQQYRLLKHHRLPARELAVQAPAAPQHLASGRRDQPVHQPQQHALARAVRSHNDGDAGFLDGEIDPIDHALAVGFVGQPAQL